MKVPTERRRAVRWRWVAVGLSTVAVGLGALAIPFLGFAPGEPETRHAFYLERARIDLAEGRSAQGILGLRRALQLDPGDATTHHELGRAYAQRRELEGALTELEQAAKLAPDVGAIYVDLARVLLLLERQSDALAAADRAISLVATSAEARSLRGEALALQGDFVGGLLALEEAAAIDPASLDIQLAISAVHLTTGDAEGAGRILRAAVEQHRDSLKARLALATFYQLVGAFDEAEAAFVDATQLAPSEPTALAQLAYHHVLAQRFDLAIDEFRRVIELDPTMIVARAHLVDLLLRSERLDEAAGLFDEVLLSEIDGWYLRGKLRIARHDFDGAIADLERVAARRSDYRFEPHPADLHVLLGRAYTRAGDPAKADAALARALATADPDPGSQLSVANLAFSRGDGAVAIERAQSVLQDFPDHPGALLLLGRALLDRGDLQEATALFERAARIAPNDPRTHLGVGLAHRRQGRSDSALAALEQTLALDPGAVAALAEIVLLLRDAGQPDRAVARTLEQLPRAAENAELRLLAAEVLVAAGRVREAEARLNESVTLAPERPEPHFQLGLLYEQLGDNARAVQSYERVLELAPETAYAANNLAWLFAAEDKRLGRALTLAEQARKQLPNDPRIGDTLGWVHYRRGDFERAIGLFTESVEAAPETPIFHQHLGMAYFKNGDGSLAARSLERFLTLAPEHAEAKATRRVLAALRDTREG